MKTQSIVVAFAFLLHPWGILAATVPSSSDPDLNHWRQVYEDTVLILLDNNTSLRDAEHIAEEIASIGGSQIITLDHEAILAAVPPARDAMMAAIPHVSRVARNAITGDRTVFGAYARFGFSFLAAAKSGGLLQNLVDARGTTPIPSEPPGLTTTSESAGGRQPTGQRLSRLLPTIEASSDNLSMGPGHVRATVIMVESNGAIDTNEFSWTPADVDDVTTRILQGYQFWLDIAPHYNKAFGITLTRFEPQYSMNLVGQPYEPIRHPSGDDADWINPIMANLGYANGDKLQRVRAYNEQFTSGGFYSSSFTTFVVYNPPGAPAQFADGANSYTYYGIAVNLLSNPFGVRSIVPQTMAHEMGHAYWACDEYAGSCSCVRCNASPPNDRPSDGVPNGNCETASCGFTLSDCMMRAISDGNFNGRRICSFTARHIGWNAVPCFNTVASGHWSAVYYNDTFDGIAWTHFAQKVMQLDQGPVGPINLDWGVGAPVGNAGCSVNSDHFSAFYQAYANFTEGTHTFTATSDDGVQVIVDGHTVIDSWQDQPPTTHTGDIYLTGGTHRVAINYYENTGGAMLQVSWTP